MVDLNKALSAAQAATEGFAKSKSGCRKNVLCRQVFIALVLENYNPGYGTYAQIGRVIGKNSNSVGRSYRQFLELVRIKDELVVSSFSKAKSIFYGGGQN